MSEEEFIEGTEETEEEGESATTAFPVEGLEVTVQMLDLWNEVLKGNISIEEFKETMEALQNLASSGSKRRRRRRRR